MNLVLSSTTSRKYLAIVTYNIREVYKSTYIESKRFIDLWVLDRKESLYDFIRGQTIHVDVEDEILQLISIIFTSLFKVTLERSNIPIDILRRNTIKKEHG